jgi:hypothetical protein
VHGPDPTGRDVLVLHVLPGFHSSVELLSKRPLPARGCNTRDTGCLELCICDAGTNMCTSIHRRLCLCHARQVLHVTACIWQHMGALHGYLRLVVALPLKYVGLLHVMRNDGVQQLWQVAVCTNWWGLAAYSAEAQGAGGVSQSMSISRVRAWPRVAPTPVSANKLPSNHEGSLPLQ